MASKMLPLEMRENAARLLRAAMSRRAKASQEDVAEQLGISQPALSNILQAKGALGVNALIAIRNYTGNSIDELLGLPPLARPQSGDEVRAMLEQILSTLPRKSSP